MAFTLNAILREETHKYLDNLDMNNIPTPRQIEDELFEEIRTRIITENAVRDKNERIKLPAKLSTSQIAEIMAKIYPIIRIDCSDKGTSNEELDLLALYQTEGDNAGIYITSDDEFRKIATQYDYDLKTRDFYEILEAMKPLLPRRVRTNDEDLIPVNNGIFNYKTKQLMPFDPDYVFTCKSHVDYNPNATNVVIHNDSDNTDWDVESWIEELTDDPELTQLIWEILGAIIRPNVPWYKSAWLYSEKGNNGKGSLCELMRNLCGERAYASVTIADFAKEFMLEPLLHASAVITDENDVGQFIDKSASIKTVITGDDLTINRKFKTPIKFAFKGFVVECINDFPRIKDKSGSWARRIMIVPFKKSFTGAERKYIKRDYLGRKEVLEYVMYKILNTNYYELSTPAACLTVFDEYQSFNNPVKEFIEEFLYEVSWSLIPFSMMYDAYKEWYKRTSPNGSIQGRNTFIKDVQALIEANDEWYYPVSSRGNAKVGDRMNVPELTIAKYNLKDWYNPTYHGDDREIQCSPRFDPQQTFRGILRKPTNGIIPDEDASLNPFDLPDKEQ